MTLDTQSESQVLTQINKFKYLGSTVTNQNRLDVKLDTWMSDASKAFTALRKQVWLNRELLIKTKWAVYLDIVLPTLLYGAET